MESRTGSGVAPCGVIIGPSSVGRCVKQDGGSGRLSCAFEPVPACATCGHAVSEDGAAPHWPSLLHEPGGRPARVDHPDCHPVR
jgi:hypothetical protein